MSLFRTRTSQSQRSQRSQHLPLAQTSSPPQVQRQPSTAELQRITTNQSSTDPLAGHLNHLTEHQERQLEKFKSTLRDQGLYRPGGNGQAPSHDEQTLLRYLRARKFDITGAFAQFADTEKWSQENKITDLYEQFDVGFYEKARKMYPQWTGRRDKRGIPVYVFVVKHLDQKHVNAYGKEAAAYKAKLPFHSSLSTPAKMLPLFALYENLLRFVLPLCTALEGRPNPEVPITNSNNIVDVSGVGMKQFWNLKSHMQESSVLANAHYPETLDRIFIIGAPSFFPTVWGWIKRWFDPVTVKKIFILPPNEVKARLSEFIDPDDFPKKYGGNLDWEIGMVPHLDQPATDAVEKNGSKGWIEGPCLWEQNQRVPVGTVDGKPRRPAKLVPSPAPPAAVNHVAVPAPTIEPTRPTDASALSANLAPPEPAEVSQPPRATHSDSTEPISVSKPPEIIVPPTVIGPPQVPESEAPIVANGQVLQAGDVKPPMERFVTANEDLRTTRAQLNAVT